MSSLPTDFDQRALTPGPRYPGHAGDRDWRKYNDALVRMGELDIEPSALEDWGRG